MPQIITSRRITRRITIGIAVFVGLIGLSFSQGTSAYAASLLMDTPNTSAALLPTGSYAVEGYGLNDLVIHNVGTSSISICRVWALPSSQVVSSRCPSTIGLLNPGQDSKTKYGWNDTDGVFVPRRTFMRVEGYPWNICSSSSLWMKISPTLVNHHYDVSKNNC